MRSLARLGQGFALIAPICSKTQLRLFASFFTVIGIWLSGCSPTSSKAPGQTPSVDVGTTQSGQPSMSESSDSRADKVASKKCLQQTKQLAKWLDEVARGKINEPPQSSLRDRLIALHQPPDPAQPAIDLSEKKPTLPELVYATCPSVLKWLPSLSTMYSAQKRMTIRTELPIRILSCHCRVSFDAVKELAWVVLVPEPIVEEYYGPDKP